MNEIVEQKRQNLAEVLQTARIQKGYSQEQLGDMVGVKYSTIGRIENCKYSPNLDIFYKIAHALEISVKVNNVEI